MNTVEAFARRLREARAGSGLGIAEVGEAIGRDGSTVSRWEKGTQTRPPSRALVVALEDVLGYDGLLEAAGYRPQSAGVNRATVEEIVKRVLDAQRGDTAAAIAEAVDQLTEDEEEARQD